MMLIGECEATIDAKNRFLLPGLLRKQLPDNEKLMLSRGIDENLVLYPMKTWQDLVVKVQAMNEFDPKVRKFRTLMLGGAVEIELDTAGRILLPPQLKDYAKLKKDISLTGDMDKIIIWDTEAYKKIFEDTSAEEFSKLAEHVGAVANKN